MEKEAGLAKAEKKDFEWEWENRPFDFDQISEETEFYREGTKNFDIKYAAWNESHKKWDWRVREEHLEKLVAVQLWKEMKKCCWITLENEAAQLELQVEFQFLERKDFKWKAKTPRASKDQNELQNCIWPEYLFSETEKTRKRQNHSQEELPSFNGCFFQHLFCKQS